MRFLSVILFAFLFCFADGNVSAVAENDAINDDISATQSVEINQNIASIKSQLDNINSTLRTNIWMTRYANYSTYQKIQNELEISENLLKRASKDNKKNSELVKKIQNLKGQLELLKGYESAPFSDMLAAPEVDMSPRITNPIALISGFSYMRKIRNEKDEYARQISELDSVIASLREKEILLVSLVENSTLTENLQSQIDETRVQIGEFEGTKQIADTTFDVYEKRADEAIVATKNEIKLQVFNTINIAVFLVVIIAISFFFKFIAKKTISDNERFYTVNKFINFINFILIIITLLFAYIDNVTYIVTVLGFASAGIAIAMKDMFMSMLGWIVIIFGGSMRVGDRVRVSHNGVTYVGDIIDISVLRMTIFEDVTMATYYENRRAGRIVFIPNNYIFTELMSNYSHHGMKTVWDGIDVVLSFDSNHKKAVYIAKTITGKYARGYTDIAKRQMTRLRSEYSIKNPNVEPRVFTFFEPHGVCISIWFMSSSHATLTLRSTISAEIVEAFNKEDDISIAYPTQTLYYGKKQSPKPHSELEQEI